MSQLKIISGGQTGADRAALDWAIAHHIQHGGWCPRGRVAEDGTIPDIYHLTETETAAYEERTEKNVLFSHATLIFTTKGRLMGGTRLTAELAQEYKRPLLHIDPAIPEPGRRIVEFIQKNRITRLNIAGPRESQEPGIGAFVRQVLDDIAGLLGF